MITFPDVETATTKELAAFFNSISDKKVTRFADRETALRRIEKLIATVSAEEAAKAAKFGPAIRNPSESGLLAIGVARSWTDPEVAAARSARHQVKLLGAGEANGVYKSLAQAIRAAHAPQPSNFIALRKSLVSEGQVSIGKFRFSLAA